MKYICLALCIIAFFACTTMAALTPLEAYEKIKDDLCSFPEQNFSSFGGDDWKGTDQLRPGKYDYTFTFCATSNEPSCAGENQGSLCQYDPKQGGKFTNTLASFANGPKPTVTYLDPEQKTGLQLTFTNGYSCFDQFDQKDRTVVVNFVCDNSVSDRVFEIAESPQCSYTIDLKHKLACFGEDSSSGASGSSGLSGGAIFLLILLGVMVVYIIAGCAICMFKFGKPFGPQACPHKDFWFSLPGWFVAGCGFAFGKIKGLCGSKTITTTSGEYEEA